MCAQGLLRGYSRAPSRDYSITDKLAEGAYVVGHEYIRMHACAQTTQKQALTRTPIRWVVYHQT